MTRNESTVFRIWGDEGQPAKLTKKTQPVKQEKNQETVVSKKRKRFKKKEEVNQDT